MITSARPARGVLPEIANVATPWVQMSALSQGLQTAPPSVETSTRFWASAKKTALPRRRSALRSARPAYAGSFFSRLDRVISPQPDVAFFVLY